MALKGEYWELEFVLGGQMRNHNTRGWGTIGVLISGAALLAGCSSADGSAEAPQFEQSPAASSAPTPAEESGGPSDVTDASPSAAEPKSGATEQDRSFLVQDAPTRFGYPVETSSVLTDVAGDIPEDQYTVTWNFDFSSDLDGDVSLYRRYRLNPNVDFSDTQASRGESRLLCIDRDDGYGGQCTGLPDGFPISLDGQYELYTQEFGPGGSQDPIDGTKEVLGSFVYTEPQYKEPLEPARCELTRGTATLEGEDFVITVNHTGECSPAQTWLGNIHGVINAPNTPPNFFPPLNVAEVSHNDATTVLNISGDALDPVLEYIDKERSDIDAFQVMSGSIEPGFEGSTVRINVQK